jgi:hypothetical protein
MSWSANRCMTRCTTSTLSCDIAYPLDSQTRSLMARQPIPRHEPDGAGGLFVPIPIEA